MSLERVLSRAEIEGLWGPSIRSVPRATFSVRVVPEELRALAHYAELWGLTDDWAREDTLRQTPLPLKQNLKWVIRTYDDRLDVWLGGPEASEENPSDAYVAYSAMRMAADSVRLPTGS